MWLGVYIERTLVTVRAGALKTIVDYFVSPVHAIGERQEAELAVQLARSGLAPPAPAPTFRDVEVVLRHGTHVVLLETMINEGDSDVPPSDGTTATTSVGPAASGGEPNARVSSSTAKPGSGAAAAANGAGTTTAATNSSHLGSGSGAKTRALVLELDVRYFHCWRGLPLPRGPGGVRLQIDLVLHRLFLSAARPLQLNSAMPLTTPFAATLTLDTLAGEAGITFNVDDVDDGGQCRCSCDPSCWFARGGSTLSIRQCAEREGCPPP